MPDKCTDPCPDLTRLEKQVDELKKQNGEDHEKIRNRLKDLEIINAVQTEQYKSILEKLECLTTSHDTLNKGLKELSEKPAKRWESLVEKTIWAVCAAVIAFLLGRIGL